MRLRILSILTALALAPLLSGSDAALGGASLAAYIASRYAPASPPPAAFTPAPWMPTASVTALIAPPAWWESMPDDAYNRLCLTPEAAAMLDDRVPAPVPGAGGWAAGSAPVAGVLTDAWQPDPDRCGDLARRLMYLATVHPQPLWHGRAAMIFEDGGWPLLTPPYIAILLGWHRADPVDDREIQETKLIAAAQGNDNPFVTIPDLAEYLWGDRAGLTVQPDEAAAPLKAVYSISADIVMNLTSPYIPADAAFCVDGNPAAGPVSLADLGAGTHELSFSSPAASGSMLFTVVP